MTRETREKRDWWKNEVIYQIYPRSFYDENGDGVGDLRGITEKLPYLERLGVTMLWLCPVFASPMSDNGYDISDYRAIAPEFGTMADMEALIEAAGKRGIKIVLDLVINHTSDEHPWFKAALKNPDSPYHDYYIFKPGAEPPNNWRAVFGGSVWEKVPGRDEYYFHAFGKKQPDLNWENPAVRRELYRMVNFWLDKGIAGFRIDAITFIKKDQRFESLPPDGPDGLACCFDHTRNQPGIGDFLTELRDETFKKYGCVTIAEAPGVPYSDLGAYIGEDGYFSMLFDFSYADLDVRECSGWFDRVPWTVSELGEKLMDSQRAFQRHGWSANYIENHDQPRATTKYLRDQAGDPAFVKMLGALYFFQRGTPFIYQGQELGMTNFERPSIEAFDDIYSVGQYKRALEEGLTPEEALYFINLRSRDNARTPFPWSGAPGGGFSAARPWLAMNENYTEINAESQVGRPGSVFEFYREMIAFRQSGPWADCLIHGAVKPLDTADDAVIAYRRETPEQRLDGYFNFSTSPVFQPLEAQNPAVVFNSQETADLREDGIWLAPGQAVLVARR